MHQVIDLRLDEELLKAALTVWAPGLSYESLAVGGTVPSAGAEPQDGQAPGPAPAAGLVRVEPEPEPEPEP